jgi:hypothetical protein
LPHWSTAAAFLPEMLSDNKQSANKCRCYFVQVKVHNRDKYQRVYEDVMRMMDKNENDYLPQVKLSAFEVSVNVAQLALYLQ